VSVLKVYCGNITVWGGEWDQSRDGVLDGELGSSQFKFNKYTLAAES